MIGGAAVAKLSEDTSAAGRTAYNNYLRAADSMNEPPEPITLVKLQSAAVFYSAIEGKASDTVSSSISSLRSYVDRINSNPASDRRVDWHVSEDEYRTLHSQWLPGLRKVFVSEKKRAATLLPGDMARIRAALKAYRFADGTAYWDHPAGIQLWAWLCVALALNLRGREYLSKTANDRRGLHMGQLNVVRLAPPAGSPPGSLGRLTYRIWLPFRKAEKGVLDWNKDTFELVRVPFGDLDPSTALTRHLETQGLVDKFGDVATPVWYKISHQAKPAAIPAPRFRLPGTYLKAAALEDLRQALQWAGYPDAEANTFTTHSLRSGGATLLMLVTGGNKELVKEIGNWKSDEAFANYNRTQDIQLTNTVDAAFASFESHTAVRSEVVMGFDPRRGVMLQPTAPVAVFGSIGSSSSSAGSSSSSVGAARPSPGPAFPSSSGSSSFSYQYAGPSSSSAVTSAAASALSIPLALGPPQPTQPTASSVLAPVHATVQPSLSTLPPLTPIPPPAGYVGSGYLGPTLLAQQSPPPSAYFGALEHASSFRGLQPPSAVSSASVAVTTQNSTTAVGPAPSPPPTPRPDKRLRFTFTSGSADRS